MSSARISARNTKRKADLVQISKALDLYYADNGAYPDTSGVWWGSCSAYGSHGANGWVPGLSPTYMGTLPSDPSGKMTRNGCGANSCYIYAGTATEYKVMAFCVVEPGPASVLASDPFNDPPRSTYDYSIYTPGARAW